MRASLLILAVVSTSVCSPLSAAAQSGPSAPIDTTPVTPIENPVTPVEPSLTGSVVKREALALNVAIPDGSGMASYTLTFDDAGMVDAAGLYFEMRHTFSADLEVSLQHPDGTIVIVRPEPETAINPPLNLTGNYGLGGSALAALDAFKGKAVKGEWKVLVKDTYFGDAGFIRALRLSIKRQ